MLYDELNVVVRGERGSLTIDTRTTTDGLTLIAHYLLDWLIDDAFALN